MMRLWNDGQYLIKVLVLMKTIAVNYVRAIYPKSISWRPSSTWVVKRILSIQRMTAQQTIYKKRKQQRIALQISDVDYFIIGVGEASRIIAWTPIQGKSLNISLTPLACNALKHRRARRITAGAATIVPYIYKEVTIEMMRKQIMTFPSNQILSIVEIEFCLWKTLPTLDLISKFLSINGKAFNGLSNIQLIISTLKLNIIFLKV